MLNGKEVASSEALFITQNVDTLLNIMANYVQHMSEEEKKAIQRIRLSNLQSQLELERQTRG